MFTGIVQKSGVVAELVMLDGAGQLILDVEPWEKPYEPGESISVNGVCLSLVTHDGPRIRFDVLLETFDKTNLGALNKGDAVNLERALCYGDALGGHIVSGHVDGRGTVRSINAVGRDRRIEISCPSTIHEHLIYKGSICCDGISLTVAELLDTSFAVHVIPITFEVTFWSNIKEGSQINLEVDLVGKYVERFVKMGKHPESVTWDAIRKQGFLS